MTQRLRIAIAGAGAIGGLLGARLARTQQHHVSVWARGATRQALAARGWQLQESDGSAWQAQPLAVGSPAELGVQDVVIVAVKAPALPALASEMAPLLGPHTRIVSAMNGVPWWWSASLPALSGLSLTSIDPMGQLIHQLPLSQVWAAVVHMAARCPEPAVVHHTMGHQLILGSPIGHPPDMETTTPRGEDHDKARLLALASALEHAGFEVRVSPFVQQEIWLKLWGNLTMNPVSALTGATADRILDDPLVRELCSQAMREAAEVGARLGCPAPMTPEERHAVTRKLGAFKTSMLQDVEAGRAIELDAIVASVHEMAQHLGVATPAVNALLGLTRLMARTRGLYPLA